MNTGFQKIGLHLDLRIQVPPVDALMRMAREAAAHGVNTLIMEWEASFPFDKNAVVTSPYGYTPGEVTRFLADCRALGLDVIALQQCFGHVEYLLQHARYAPLRESEGDLCQVCPCRTQEAIAVFRSLFEEIIAVHSSPYLHIGGDETYLLGHCPRCRQQVEAHGKSQLYVNYFAQIAREVVALGKRPLLWADMLLRYPEAAAQMPPECIFIDWNYGWPVNRFGDFDRFAELPFEFWGAVAMRSAPDNHASYAWRTHLDNFRDYIPAAHAKHFSAMILTSWSTSGVYGYEWELPGKPLALYPLRRVVPHAGLPVLVKAFAHAARNPGHFDGDAFILRYGEERFGFTTTQAQQFRKALACADPSAPARGGKTPAKQGQALLRALTPATHACEFERYRLMVDLTAHDEQVSLLEARMQSTHYTRASRAGLHDAAEALLQEGERLSSRFDTLYSGELYPHELKAESDYRLKRIRTIVARTGSLHRLPVPSGSLGVVPTLPPQPH